MKTIIILIFACVTGNGWTQDYHHWSEHFGARASLLGGAATSGLGDNATVYYNAAAMAFVEDPSVSISVNAYKYRERKLENAMGPDLDLKENQLSSMPNLIAGIMTFEKAKRFRLGYAVLTRRAYTSKFDYLHVGRYEIINSVAGEEEFVASYNIYHQLSEYWAGFGLSYQLSDGFAVGFAHYGIYRDVKYANSHSATVLPNNGWAGEVTSVATDVTFNYWNVKGIFKPSISLTIENFKFGMAYTTPSFNMFGNANVYRDYTVVNLDQVWWADYDFTFVDRVENVKVKHKENGALAIGVSWKLGEQAWLHFSNETFFGNKYYLIFDPDQIPNAYPDSTFTNKDIYEAFGAQNFTALGEETKTITNFGIGFESIIGKTWEMYMGARTDFLYNARPNYDYKRMGIDGSKNNNYHFSFGLIHITKKEKRYTIGLEYGLSAKQKYHSVIDFTTPTLQNSLFGNGNENVITSQNSFKLLIEIEIGKGLLSQ